MSIWEIIYVVWLTAAEMNQPTVFSSRIDGAIIPACGGSPNEIF